MSLVSNFLQGTHPVYTGVLRPLARMDDFGHAVTAYRIPKKVVCISLSSECDSGHPSTNRLYTSMMAVRYKNPRGLRNTKIELNHLR